MSGVIHLILAGLAHPHAAYVLDEVAASPDLRLVGVVEPDPELSAAWVSRLGGVPVFDQLEAASAAGQVDVVAIAAPYAQRASLVLEALDSGASVLCDKPLCTDLEQLTAIERAAGGRPAAVSVMFEKRGYPATRAVIDLARQGALGEVALVATTGPHQLRPATRPPWFFDPDRYGTVLGDLAVHDCDLYLLLTGERAGTVTGFARTAADSERLDRTAGPDRAAWQDRGAMLVAGRRSAATIEAHWMWPTGSAVHGHYRMRVTGTAAVAEVDWARRRVDLVTADADVHPVPLPVGLRPAEDFFAALREGRQPEVDTAAGVAATRLALLAARSATHGGQPQAWSVEPGRGPGGGAQSRGPKSSTQ